MRNQPFFCSWSGGKDSCLALYHAIRRGGRPECLLTMMAEDGTRSRSHALPRAVLEAQARSLGLPIVFRSASWETYEEVFTAALHAFREQGIKTGVFGDLDIDAHRQWVRTVCAQTNITPVHPLWKRDRREVLDAFIALGFESIIIVVKADKLGEEFLGQAINEETIARLERAGVDPCGEWGEYHTVVTTGPLFSSDISFKTKRHVHHEGYGFLKMESTCQTTKESQTTH